MDRICRLVIIEGNISAGKSTLAKDLGRKLGLRVFLEPTLVNPYLEKFYENPRAYALKMQVWLLRQRFLTYLTALRYMLETGNGVLLDRSVFSDSVFAVKNKWDENITQEGFEYYLELRKQMLTNLPIPHVTLYLDVNPKTCFDRVHHMRQRDCESGIPLEYLSGLDLCYRQFLKEMESLGSNMVVVPWDNFGCSDEIAGKIRAASSGKSMSWGQHVDRLRALLYDEASIRQRMHIKRRLADAEDDVDVLKSRGDEFFAQAEGDNAVETDVNKDLDVGTPNRPSALSGKAISPIK